MSSDIEMWQPPNDPTAFESLCLDIWKEIWNDPGAQKNGRSEQPQAGVDVFGKMGGRQIGVQSKQKDGLLRTELTVDELEQEVEKAKNFRPPLATLFAKKNFFVPIQFDSSQRKSSSIPTQADTGHWHPVSLVFQ